MYLEAFGVKNLRCLTDTGLVPIRPITLLVGRNSSGKSTFLRAFPLLRQSVETARNSPVLWYDDRYVDFGSLQAAANNRLSEPSVTFMFRLRAPESIDLEAEVAMTLAGGENPYVSAYEIHGMGQESRWTFDAHRRAQSVTIDGSVVALDKALALGDRAYFLPSILPWKQDSTLRYVAAPDTLRFDRDGDPLDSLQALLVPFAAALMPFLHGDPTTDDNARKIQSLIPDTMRQKLASVLVETIPKQDVHTLSDTDLWAVATNSLALKASLAIRFADMIIAHLMSSVSYLAPLRVVPLRSYRIQNLAVDEVAPDGGNLAMFLHSLSPMEVDSFADFTRAALGFETMVKAGGIHAEILVKSGSASRFVNLVDVGFGYSEVLPLAATLWSTCVRPGVMQQKTKLAKAKIVAVEQPELHLHPGHQAKLARMFVEAASRSRADGVGAQIIVETHSESLINGLGKLVYEGLIKAEDIQIVLFDQDEETGDTSVRLAGYNENGALHDWPYGFLSPVAERRVSPAAE